MAAGLDTERLGFVFQSRPDIIAGIQKAADSPARVSLFNNIASFVYGQLSNNDPAEPALKRRKLDGSVAAPTNGQANGASGGGAARSGNSSSVNAADAGREQVLLEVKEISLSIPQRKKYELCFTKNFLYARAPGTSAPVQGIVYAWRDIEHAFYLPVPDKSQMQYNYVLFPRGTALTSASKATAAAPPAPGEAPVEPLLFTVPATAPKPGSVSGPLAGTAATVSDSYSSLLHWAIGNQLRAAAGAGGGRQVAIVSADPKVFHSVQRQAHRPGDMAVHVKAFRGSKDGYLFFLPSGILWGFKKPLLFVPLERVVAVSYTSVLQRTFNIVVEVDLAGLSTGGGGDGANKATEEIEFAMLDQEDYGGIDETYVRRHGLQDRSMAEARKAKRELAENARDGGGKKKGGEEADDGLIENGGAVGGAAAPGEGEEDDGLTELQRAEMQLQDEEDELEEDYDPGSEGDSDGSGASSDEEDGEEYEEGEGEGEEGEEGEGEEYDEEDAEGGEHYYEDEEGEEDEQFDVVG